MPTKQQFDLSHLKIDSKWQGSMLASFGRRTVAYLIDWTIVLICTQYLWISILVLVLLIAVRKRYRNSLLRGSVYMRYSLRKLDNELEKYNVEQTLRSRLTRHL